MSIKLIIAPDSEGVAQTVSEIAARTVSVKPDAVLGLATGSTYEGVYDRLATDREIHARDWSRVRTFNLDEYVGLAADDPNSYNRYMRDRLFARVNIDPANARVPDGMRYADADVRAYEAAIESAGGVDVQFLGIGTNGHIGFNEPGTSFASRTRVVDLAQATIAANAAHFARPEDVPRRAVSMGIATIMAARKIVLAAFGAGKADAIRALLEGEISPAAPCSALRAHADVTVVVDRAAASKLRLGLLARLTRRATYPTAVLPKEG